MANLIRVPIPSPFLTDETNGENINIIPSQRSGFPPRHRRLQGPAPGALFTFSSSTKNRAPPADVKPPDFGLTTVFLSVGEVTNVSSTSLPIP
eukprot:CAMPEP_0201243158 /NCGR_PEP_ID=MMETSP0852-20130820/40371_1 /ASSEMBLY_ACC=CAM_ASM_000632 /TAXON_ID=183588 /ORGANISM="Pseudo-nitzschia fraudulenta, Strain WWA7" /LENGTH=92 /DNA_ID=CAMNT_0047540101 /DNA_START=111 /DNA_END=386 /DNA_ORIENTATION=+